MSANDQGSTLPSGDDALDRLIRDARFSAPPGLAARLAANAVSPAAARVIFWADVERIARSLVGKTAAAAVLMIGLALGVTMKTGNVSPDRSAVHSDDDVTYDQLESLALAPSVDAMVAQVEQEAGY